MRIIKKILYIITIVILLKNALFLVNATTLEEIPPSRENDVYDIYIPNNTTSNTLPASPILDFPKIDETLYNIIYNDYLEAYNGVGLEYGMILIWNAASYTNSIMIDYLFWDNSLTIFSYPFGGGAALNFLPTGNCYQGNQVRYNYNTYAREYAGSYSNCKDGNNPIPSYTNINFYNLEKIYLTKKILYTNYPGINITLLPATNNYTFHNFSICYVGVGCGETYRSGNSIDINLLKYDYIPPPPGTIINFINEDKNIYNFIWNIDSINNNIIIEGDRSPPLGQCPELYIYYKNGVVENIKHTEWSNLYSNNGFCGEFSIEINENTWENMYNNLVSKIELKYTFNPLEVSNTIVNELRYNQEFDTYEVYTTIPFTGLKEVDVSSLYGFTLFLKENINPLNGSFWYNCSNLKYSSYFNSQLNFNNIVFPSEFNEKMPNTNGNWGLYSLFSENNSGYINFYKNFGGNCKIRYYEDYLQYIPFENNTSSGELIIGDDTIIIYPPSNIIDTPNNGGGLFDGFQNWLDSQLDGLSNFNNLVAKIFNIIPSDIRIYLFAIFGTILSFYLIMWL